MIGWDALTAIASAVSAAVVVVGGAIAIYQLREGRRAAQFDATQRMVDRTLEPVFYRAVRFVVNDLPTRMADKEYTFQLERFRGWDIDPDVHPELIVLARLEEAGIYLRHRLLLGDALLDFNAEMILETWEHLKPVVALMRRSHRNPRVWSNAEYLYARAQSVRQDAASNRDGRE